MGVTAGDPFVTLGEVVAAKRGERGLTIEQAAAATWIRAHYLSALESDELERLAAPVYVDGRAIGALGSGVATRDFTSQTSS